MADRKFAFGCNEFEDTECPAMAAGLRPDNGCVAANIAERYDEKARTEVKEDEGLISESEAKSLWDRTVRGVKMDIDLWRDSKHHNEEEVEWLERVAEAGEKVQEELDWN